MFCAPTAHTPVQRGVSAAEGRDSRAPAPHRRVWSAPTQRGRHRQGAPPGFTAFSALKLSQACDVCPCSCPLRCNPLVLVEPSAPSRRWTLCCAAARRALPTGKWPARARATPSTWTSTPRWADQAQVVVESLFSAVPCWVALSPQGCLPPCVPWHVVCEPITHEHTNMSLT